jgi:hypothetical protein
MVPLFVAVTEQAPSGATTYTARGLFLITPSSGLGASELASTYAAFLPQDRRLTDDVGRRALVPGDVVRQGLRAVKLETGALLEISYQSDGPDRALRVLRSLAAAMTASPPASPTVLPRSVTVVNIPDLASSTSSTSSSGIPVAAVLGVLLGIALVVGLERADTRVDDEQELAEALDAPVFALGDVEHAHAEILLARWTEEDRTSEGVTVVPVDRGATAAATRLVARMAEVLPAGHGEDLVVDLEHPVERWRSAGAPPARVARVIVTAPAASTQSAVIVPPRHIVVAVAAAGCPLRHVRTARRRIEAAGVRIDWGLLLSPGGGDRPTWPVAPTRADGTVRAEPLPTR